MTRARRIAAIWLLPGAALLLSPEGWHGVPHGVQWAGYVASLVLLSAACSLILNPDHEHASRNEQDSGEPKKQRKQRRLEVLSKDTFTSGA